MTCTIKNLCLSKKLILNCCNSVHPLGATVILKLNFYYKVYGYMIIDRFVPRESAMHKVRKSATTLVPIQ